MAGNGTGARALRVEFFRTSVSPFSLKIEDSFFYSAAAARFGNSILLRGCGLAKWVNEQ